MAAGVTYKGVGEAGTKYWELAGPSSWGSWAGLTLARATWCGRGQDGGAYESEDGAAPSLSGCPGQLDSRVAWEGQSWLLAGHFLPRGKEEGEGLQIGVPPGQRGRSGSPSSPFRLPELVPPPHLHPHPQVEAVVGVGGWKTFSTRACPGSHLSGPYSG